MIMAFILAGLVFAGTLALCALIYFADSMSDAPSEDGVSPVPAFVIGTGIALVLVASHFVAAAGLGW